MTTSGTVRAATTAGYGGTARLFHWSMAAIFLVVVPTVLLAEQMPRGPTRGLLFDVHRLLGAMVLPLGLARLAWRLAHPPPPLASPSPWERVAARAVHGALYAAMVTQPVTGYLMYALEDGQAELGFGVALPGLGVRDEAVAGVLRGAHELVGFAVVAFLALHLAGVAKHTLIDRDGTLHRMLGGGRPASGGALARGG